jgi:hypothetical protein
MSKCGAIRWAFSFCLHDASHHHLSRCSVFSVGVTSPAQRMQPRIVRRTQLGQIKYIVNCTEQTTEGFWPHIRTTSETCLKQVLGSLRPPGTLQHSLEISSDQAQVSKHLRKAHFKKRSHRWEFKSATTLHSRPVSRILSYMTQ